MIGIEKVWKSVKTRKAAEPVPGSSVPRDIRTLKTTLVEPMSAFSEVPLNETRSADRFVPNKTSTVLTTEAGKRIAARIINISRTGVAVEAELTDTAAREIAMVGTRPVMPGRRISRGMVFMFKKPLDPKLCDPSILL